MKKILSLDGGGIKGLFTLGVLSKFEEFQNESITKYFDLIVGTSTGGIIALGLGKGFSAKELLSFYMDMGDNVFSGNRALNFLKHLVSAKYDNFYLETALREKFLDTKLGESTTRLIIPSQVLETGKIHLYKTAHHKNLREDYKKNMLEIAMATSAAPSYFPTFRSKTGLVYVDGGTYANNPIAIAAVEARTYLGWTADETHILSIGCTNEPLNVKAGKKYPLGRLYWAFKAIDTMMKGQFSAAEGMAIHLTNRQVLRIDETVANGKFKLDSSDLMDDLSGLGQETGRNMYQKIQHFFMDPAEPFVPFYKL